MRNIRLIVLLALLGSTRAVLAGCEESCEALHRIDFGPASVEPESGYERDSGGLYSTEAGFGWLPGSPALVSRNRSCSRVPEHQLSLLFTVDPRTWEVALPNGDYSVTVSLGDCSYTQGPQRLLLEGALVVDGELTHPDSFLTLTRTVAVRDGRLSVEIGGGGGRTTLNSIDVDAAATGPATLLSINFQDSSVPPPDSFVADTGAPYDSETGRGWSRNLMSKARTRGIHEDPVLDGFVFVGGLAAQYEIALPLGTYDVDLSVGDALYPQGPFRLLCEGSTWLDGETTAANEFRRLRGPVHVTDGRLTLEIGGAGGLTPLNFLAVSTRQAADLRVNFQPPGSPVPEDYQPDSGAAFSASRGYGWTDAPGSSSTRDREVEEDQRLDTLLFADSPHTWEIDVPEGDYEVTVVCGDPTYAQGPHEVTVEGVTAHSGESTLAGEFLERTVRASVLDGRLSLQVGGWESRTTLNYVEIASVSDVAAIRFQPEEAETPAGFEPDSGRAYSPETGYGWEDDFLYDHSRARERELLEGLAQDTLIFTTGSPEVWSHDLPDGDYRVTVSVGDARYAQGPHRVYVEGTAVIDWESTAKGQFLVGAACVTVSDGALSVEIGGSEGNTTLNYVVISGASCQDEDEEEW